MSDTYSKNEIDLMQKPITQKLCTIEDITKETLKHVKRTNGRVTDLEVESARRGGGIKVLSIVVLAIILPIMGWALYILTNVDDLIQDTVKDLVPEVVHAQLDNIELEAYINE